MRMIENFLDTPTEENCTIFLRRYWYLDPISAISQQFGFSESKVKMMLHRQRQGLLSHLEREEFL